VTVTLRTEDGELKVEKGARIRINGIGDISVDGYLRPQDEPVDPDGKAPGNPGLLTTLCIAKGDYVLYAMIDGTVQAVDRPKKGVTRRAARSE
jgi:hypothetical protein